MYHPRWPPRHGAGNPVARSGIGRHGGRGGSHVSIRTRSCSPPSARPDLPRSDGCGGESDRMARPGGSARGRGERRMRRNEVRWGGLHPTVWADSGRTGRRAGILLPPDRPDRHRMRSARDQRLRGRLLPDPPPHSDGRGMRRDGRAGVRRVVDGSRGRIVGVPAPGRAPSPTGPASGALGSFFRRAVR